MDHQILPKTNQAAACENIMPHYAAQGPETSGAPLQLTPQQPSREFTQQTLKQGPSSPGCSSVHQTPPGASSEHPTIPGDLINYLACNQQVTSVLTTYHE